MSDGARLDDLGRLAAHARSVAEVPGLAFAVSLNRRTTSAAHGVLNVATGLEARPDSLFQVGSITKALTATLVMQAAEENLLDIDAPIVQYIYEPLGRGEHAGRFTARELMSHMTGLDGDFFPDTGRDEDAIARYTALCGQLDFLAPPGRYYNYCNAGYAILGRLLEVVRGKTFDRILREHLLDPIGAARSTTFAEEAAFARAAVGHESGPDGKASLVPARTLPRGLGPAGMSLYSTVEELVAFANAHMESGPLITRASAEAMRTPHATLPENAAWGLGWKLVNRDGVAFAGHDGGTIGQAASLWFAPQFGLAIAMCANGGRAREAWRQVAHPLFRSLCGALPEGRVSEALPGMLDLSVFEGVYENLGVIARISAEGGDSLRVVAEQKHFSLPDIVFFMRPIGGDRFRATIGDDDVITAFYDRGLDGRPALFYAGRLHRRTGY